MQLKVIGRMETKVKSVKFQIRNPNFYGLT